MTHSINDAERLQTLLDATAEFLLEASDEEILEDLRAEGANPERVAQEARVVLDNALRTRGRRRLLAAREGLQRDREGVDARSGRRSIPAEPAARRKLLDWLLARNDLPQAMTMAFREGKHLPDDEVLSALEDLADLGLLDDNAEKE